MYGTIARMKFKPGMAQKFMEMMVQQGEQRRAAAGSVTTYVYQMDQDPDEIYLAVVFESREAYVANANSPEQHQDFLQMMEYLESEPEWHDGEIIWQGT